MADFKYQMSAYDEVYFSKTWYVDEEIENLNLKNLNTILKEVDKKQNLFESYKDEAILNNIQLLLLYDYKEIEVSRYPEGLYLGEFFLKVTPLEDFKSQNVPFKVSLYHKGKKENLLVGDFPEETSQQLYNLVHSKIDLIIEVYLSGGPYKTITLNDNGSPVIKSHTANYQLIAIVSNP